MPLVTFCEKKNKRWWFVGVGCEARGGPRAQRPVILPPLEAGGIRCSVKPASRNARRSRCRDAEAFAKAPAAHYATWNGRAAECDNQTQAQSAAIGIRTTLMPPARVTSSRYLLGE